MMKEDKVAAIQAHIFYSGTVQGVGFRYTIQRFVEELKLTGWVKNLRDGRVEIMVEGNKESVEQLIERTNKYFDGYIRDSKVTYAPAQNLFVDFRIA